MLKEKVFKIRLKFLKVSEISKKKIKNKIETVCLGEFSSKYGQKCVKIYSLWALFHI